ncbi:helix-turn-helix domain-containing protein [Pseudonocardia xishanensis]|uniref:Helix-turn-helix domain-containing protein n=1 Tax=Pseudonocardia xishanensis TaxID=630995 RepID=A0ABP8RHQ8_9PSEU
MELRDWLSAIGALTAAVNAGRGLREVLDLVAATARELLGLDFCGVLVPDADERTLVIVGWDGLPEEYVARVNSDRPVPLEADATVGAPSSRAYRSGEPFAIADISLDPDFVWGGVARELYRSMLSVPLVTASGVIGTLNSYRSAVHEFGPEETGRLALLAEHAAIAITSARVLEDLRHQHDLVTRSEEIHERLLRVAVRAGGIAGIVTALHDLLGSPVQVLDARGDELASAPAGGRPPAGAHAWVGAGPRAGAPADGPASDPDVHRRSGAALVREVGEDVVADVVLSGEVAARVVVPGRAGTLAALDRRALEHASIVLSLELLRQRTAQEVEQNLRGELLSDLLAGADPGSAAVRDRAALLGHDLGRSHRALVARVTPDSPAVVQRAVAEAAREVAGVRPRPLVAAHREVVVALWPESDGAAAEVLRRALLRARGVVDAVVAVSAAGDALVEAYRTARGALALAGPGRRIVELDDLGVVGLLLRLDDPAPLRAYADRALGPLLSYDREHGAALVETLRTHLDHDLDRRATAEALTVHPNTVSQRLRRIEALTGLDLRSSRAVVEARSALVVLDVATTHPPR